MSQIIFSLKRENYIKKKTLHIKPRDDKNHSKTKSIKHLEYVNNRETAHRPFKPFPNLKLKYNQCNNKL